ncbi:hypothetical protein H7F37_03900 [Winogradskyella sp. PAMC22761]|nr:hypothetical protein H7F37_03900 [Winogradskyella sp. PAMC22761]
MRKTISILIIPILLTSCIDKTKKLDKDELCEKLVDMSLSDQKYRGMREMSNPFFEILDSLRSANNLTLEDYGKLPKEKQLEYGAKAKSIADKKPKFPQSIKDSLMSLQIEVDNLNTEKLIEIIKINGWPIKNGFRCDEVIGPSIIFRHSQEKYWNEIQTLIDLEFKEKRMSKGEYNLIDNHLKGRPSYNFTKD